MHVRLAGTRRGPCAAAAALACALATPAGQAEPMTDERARDAIELALDELYLPMRFAEAEQLLLETIQRCENVCLARTVASAWAFVGVIRVTVDHGSAGAKEAFSRALAADPGIELDPRLSSEPSRAVWQQAVREMKWDKGSHRWSFACTPVVSESQTRRRIPVSCPASAAVASMTVRYREWGDQHYQSVELWRTGREFRALLPCSATGQAGVLRFYVTARSPSGHVVGRYGSRQHPIELAIRDTSAVVPAFPGAAPPPRCPAGIECPPDFPGCVPAGGHCRQSRQCQAGLTCARKDGAQAGTCRPIRSCQSDHDCGDDRCHRGNCVSRTARQPRTRHTDWLGLHAALDFAYLPSAQGICSAATQSSPDAAYRCYRGGVPYPDRLSQPYDSSSAGTVVGGMQVANVRLLLSYERALGPRFWAGARAGYAIRGAPQAFTPIHLEMRVGYWMLARPLTHALRPRVFASAGLGEFSASTSVVVQDYQPDTEEVAPRPVEGWAQFGRWFVGGGFALVMAATEAVSLEFGVGSWRTLPDSTFVIEPTAGLVVGL
jgi:hypothetical protein